MDWKPYPQTPPKHSGDYMCLFGGLCEPFENEVRASVEHYYLEGEIIDNIPSDIPSPAELRLLDSVLNKRVHVAKQGFYACADQGESWNNHYEIKPIFWAELPEPPEGYSYSD